MSQESNFCHQCGSVLHMKEIESKIRPTCLDCGYVLFQDPRLATAVLVTVGRKLVMVKRGVEPFVGSWAFPSGYVDRCESVEEAAVREVKEETGLKVRIIDFVGLYSNTGDPVVLAVYSAKVADGILQAGGDALEVALFDFCALPPLPFPHDKQIITDWGYLCEIS